MVAATRYDSAMRWSTPSTRMVPSSYAGNPCISRPSAKMSPARITTFRNNVEGRVPSSSKRPSESVVVIPTMKRKNGNTRSVGVQPFQAACSSGG
jgi:hypothetical protein